MAMFIMRVCVLMLASSAWFLSASETMCYKIFIIRFISHTGVKKDLKMVEGG